MIVSVGHRFSQIDQSFLPRGLCHGRNLGKALEIFVKITSDANYGFAVCVGMAISNIRRNIGWKAVATAP
jgi:hypothetical protein